MARNTKAVALVLQEILLNMFRRFRLKYCPADYRQHLSLMADTAVAIKPQNALPGYRPVITIPASGMVEEFVQPFWTNEREKA